MKMLKKIGLGLFVTLFGGSLLLSTLASKPVNAAVGPEALPRITFVTVDGSKVYFNPDEFKVTASFIDRSNIRLTVSGSRADYTIDGVPLKDLVEGVYFDDNLNSNFSYKDTTDCSEDDGSDCWSVINRFNGSVGTNKDGNFDNPDYIKAVDTATLWKDGLQNVQFVLAIDEETLPTINCGSDEPIVLTVNSGDKNGQDFSCVEGNKAQATDSGDVAEATGMNFRESDWDAASFPNFNIVYRYNGADGEAARLISVDGDTNNDFWFCENSDGKPNNVFVRGGCNNGEYIEVSTEALKAGALIPLTITDNDGDTVDIVVAGSLVEVPTDINVGGGTSAPTEPSCESEGGVFSWILCGALDLTSRFLQFVDDQLTILLNIPSDYYDNPTVTIAWSRMRNIAYLLLIPIFLVMILSTMLGFNFVDAYTVKRSLPRLLVAVVFIALSLPLCQMMVTVVNEIGQGIYGLIVGAVGATQGGTEKTLTDFFDPNNLQGGLFGAAVVVGAVLAPGMIVTILLFALSAGLVLLTAFFLLALRQMLVVGLIIVSPLAILSWIFPGNDKLWKLWWNSFSKLLYLYPIILGLIATGKVFATIVDGVGGSGFVNTILILVAYVGPYFLIPATFRMAGNAFASLSGMVNNRSKGAFDRLRNARSKQYKSRWHDAKAGNYYKGTSRLGQRINRGVEGATNINKAGFNPVQMRSKMRTAMNDASHDEASKYMKENADFLAFSGDDAKVAAAKFTKREDIEAELARFDNARFGGPQNARARTDAATQIMRAQRGIGAETFQRARARAMASTGTGYQYKDANGNTVVDVSRMVDDINEAYGNDRGGAGRALAEMRSSLTNSGQIAGMAGYGTWASVMEQRYRGTISNQDAHNTIMDDAIVSASPGQALYGKPTSAAAMGAAHARRIQATADRVSAARAALIAGTGTQEDVIRAESDLDATTAAAAGLLDAMGQASPNNASAFANELMGVKINGAGVGAGPQQTGAGGITYQPTAQVTVREMIDERMNNPEYRNRRRDYGSQALTQGAAWQQQQAAQAAANNAAGGGGAPGAGPGGLPNINTSDARLKENIKLVGKAGNINQYRFNYLGDNQEYVGVIAQEILEIHPEAVVIDDLGFYAVDYQKINLRMMTYEDWKTTKTKSASKTRY